MYANKNKNSTYYFSSLVCGINFVLNHILNKVIRVKYEFFNFFLSLSVKGWSSSKAFLTIRIYFPNTKISFRSLIYENQGLKIAVTLSYIWRI